MNRFTKYTPRKLYGIDAYEDFDYSEFEDVLFTEKTERMLYTLFDELDGLVIEYLPESLIIKPVQVIQKEFGRLTGQFVTQQEILDAFDRYLEVDMYE